MSSTKQKTSSVWLYYCEEYGTPFAQCSLCSSKIKRGQVGDKKTWMSKPLWSHLKTKHHQQYRDACENRENTDRIAKKSNLGVTQKQAVYVNVPPKLAALIEKNEKCKPYNAAQKNITEEFTICIGLFPSIKSSF